MSATDDRPGSGPPGPLTLPLAGLEQGAGEQGAGEVRATVERHLAKGAHRDGATIWRANPREQGLLGLTDAIQWFGANGYSISLPLIDAQPYDLIVDDGTHLQRVQVKTTTQRSDRGHFIVQLCTRGGNQSFQTTKPFDPAACDLLYVLTDDGQRFCIPVGAFTARTGLTLNDRFWPYTLADPRTRASPIGGV